MERDYANKYIMSGYMKPVRKYIDYEVPGNWTDEEIADFCKRKDVTWIKN